VEQGLDIARFRLPTQPVEYVPQGDLVLVTEKILDISPKAIHLKIFVDVNRESNVLCMTQVCSLAPVVFDVCKSLPTQPVEYVPQGDLVLVTEKILDISPKALFHILFV
jgi:hypothetical protein